MFKLVIQDDEGKTTVVPLIRDEITIGRKEGNTIRLTERNVSRRHARILRNNGEVHIEDLGSYNGIRVNNARIAERVSLRVSDQVQIGDYKLYLKAEGVEQVDDARTMPIERVETAGGAPTEVIPAIPPPAVTAQVAAVAATPAGTPVPPPAPAPPQLIGNPARTMVAISGDDAGRPVATAAVVAALNAPVGHGKLVVLSSNFAGKEFELTRLQMIIGRTDENDIVINHRSISRNHAKIVREPESQRYTISDLQSSNGVRVNGQDYGKVELRRGDVVDLGHVRLRFIEPGEDFVFARDAVITDVPEAGSKRGMLVAIILGVIVLGGAAAFFAMKGNGGGDNKDQPAQNGTDGSAQTRVVTPDAVDAHVAELGADAAVAMIDTPADAAPAVAPRPGDDAATTELKCKTYAGTRDWDNEISCARDKLSPLDGAAGKRLVDAATKEKGASTLYEGLTQAVAAKNVQQARLQLAKIPETSVYHRDGEDAVSKLAAIQASGIRDEINKDIGLKKCAEAKSYLETQGRKLLGPGPDGIEQFRSLLDTCKPPPIADNPDPNPTPHPVPHPPPPGIGSASTGSAGTAVTIPPAACDADEHRKKGEAATQSGSHPAALAEFEKSLACKHDAHVVALAYMEACAGGNAGKARQYFAQMPLTGSYSQATLLQMCMRIGIDPKGTK